MSADGPGVTRDDTPVGVIRPLVDERPATARQRRGEGGGASRRPRRSNARRALRAALVVVVVVAGYYSVSLYQVWSTGRSDQARPVDAIVVMGAAQYDGEPSPLLAARLDHVVELWPQGLAPIVVVTGGKLEGDRFTEAEASAAYLVERGVPSDAIVFENEGRTSYQSLRGVEQILRDRDAESVLIVTDPYHSLRSRLIAQQVGLRAYVSPTPASVVTGAGSLRRHLQEAAGVAAGRLIGFARL